MFHILKLNFIQVIVGNFVMNYDVTEQENDWHGKVLNGVRAHSSLMKINKKKKHPQLVSDVGPGRGMKWDDALILKVRE